MIGLLKPSKGTITLFGKDINEFKNFEKIGYISQNVRDFNQMFPATIEEIVSANLYLGKGLFNKTKEKDSMKVDRALRIVEMERFKNVKIGNLSGGQKQRVFIARALVNNPNILFMDEPLVGVDLESQTRFYSLMDKLNKEYGITLVMISHDIGIMSKKVNRILCLSKGKVYCHDSNKCQCGNVLTDIYGESINLLFHDH